MRVLKMASIAALAAWAGLVFARGRFWEARADDLREPARPFSEAPRVHAIVPARNEEAVLALTLQTLLAQRDASGFGVTLDDDNSDDATADIARLIARTHPAGARLTVVQAGRRPHGWAGKVWALREGVAAALAEHGAPDYWLFTDADIAHDAGSIASLVATAVERRRDLVSLMVRLRCSTPWERLLIPAFVYFFRKLFPFRWVNDDRELTAAAAGGCVLISHDALNRIGGLERIASAVIDDCSLAAAVKRSGGRLWLGLSTRVESIRPYESLSEIWTMVARSAYAQLDYSKANLIGTAFGMTLLYAVPPLATAVAALRRDRVAFSAAASAWTIMILTYLPTLRLYRQPPIAGLGLPLSAALYTAMTLDSARRHESGLGNPWKGRALNGKPPTMTTPPAKMTSNEPLPPPMPPALGEHRR
jgi:hopene-associated glycosyltransferase HpnB